MKRLLSIFLACIIFAIFVPVIGLAASKPSAPSVNSYTAISDASIKIGWGKVSGATKYRVDRRRTDEANYKTLTSSCTATSYTDSGLKAGSTYYYRVYAINSAGTSARSITYEAHTKPNNPAISYVNRDSDTQLTIKWNSVSGATKYKIMYRRGDKEDYQTLVTNVTGTSYTHKNLTPNARYWYRVYAIREANIGPEGSRTKKNIESDRSETLGNFTKIARPSNGVDNDKPTTVKLSWTKAYGNNEYSYDIYRKAPTDSGFKKITRTKALSYLDTGLTPGVIYKYKINTVVTSDGGSCTWCDEFYAGPKITKEINLTPQSGTSMKISWDKPSSEKGLKYAIYKWNGNEYNYYATTSNTYYIDNNLKADETYRYYVQVRDSSDNYLTSTYGKSAVLQILPTGISLNKTSANIGLGETLTLSASLTPNNSTNKAVTWTSSNSNIASVSSNGVVTAKSMGKATVTVKTSNGKTAVCTISITTCPHTYGSWTTEINPSCEKKGRRYRVCSKCKNKDYDDVDAAGHSYSSDFKIIKTPTCIENGEQANVCSICGASKNIISIDALGHNFPNEWIVTREATCVQDGIEYRNCLRCHTTDIRTIYALPHDFGEWQGIKATCTENGDEYRICKGCGYKDKSHEKAVGHQLEFLREGEHQGTEVIIDIYKCKICQIEVPKVRGQEEIDGGDISISNYIAKRGDSVTISVNLNNNPGISSFKLHLQYDHSVMEPQIDSNGEIVSYGILLNDNNGNKKGSLKSNLSQDIYINDPQISWTNDYIVNVDGTKIENITEDGELFQITFKIKDDAYSGKYPISLSYFDGDILNKDGAIIKCDLFEGSVSIEGGGIIRGDINMDGMRNNSDCLLLARYIVTQNAEKKDKMFSESQKQAADVYPYPEDSIDHWDGIRLSQLIAGYKFNDNTSSKIKMFSEELPAEITIANCRGMSGQLVEVPVKIKNNSGFAGFNLIIRYDNNYLKPIEVSAGDLLDTFDIKCISNITEGSDEQDSGVVSVYCGGSENYAKNICGDGELFSVKFQIKENVPANSEIALIPEYTENAICRISGNDISSVPFTLNQGKISVEESNIAYDTEIVSQTISPDGNLDLTLNIKSRKDRFVPAVIIAAAYDENGKVISLKTENMTEQILNDGICNIHIECTDTPISYVRSFMWNSVGEMLPLSEVKTLSI